MKVEWGAGKTKRKEMAQRGTQNGYSRAMWPPEANKLSRKPGSNMPGTLEPQPTQLQSGAKTPGPQEAGRTPRPRGQAQLALSVLSVSLTAVQAAAWAPGHPTIHLCAIIREGTGPPALPLWTAAHRGINLEWELTWGNGRSRPGDQWETGSWGVLTGDSGSPPPETAGPG